MLSQIPSVSGPVLFSGRKHAHLSAAERDQLDTFERGLEALKKTDRQRPHPVIRRMRVNRMVRAARRFIRQRGKPARPFVIGVSGGSGSGKSTLVAAWRDHGIPLEVITQDCYYRDMSGLRTQCRLEAETTGVDRFRSVVDLNSPDAVSLGKAARDLQQLKKGQTIRVPAYDFVTCIRQDRATEVKPTRVVITEGVFGFANRSLRRLMDLRVFMDISPAVQAERFWKRAPERGIRNDEAGQQFFRDVQAKHARYIQPTAEKAHLILDGEAEPGLLRDTVNELTRLVLGLIEKPGGR